MFLIIFLNVASSAVRIIYWFNTIKYVIHNNWRIKINFIQSTHAIYITFSPWHSRSCQKPYIKPITGWGHSKLWVSQNFMERARQTRMAWVNTEYALTKLVPEISKCIWCTDYYTTTKDWRKWTIPSTRFSSRSDMRDGIYSCSG